MWVLCMFELLLNDSSIRTVLWIYPFTRECYLSRMKTFEGLTASKNSYLFCVTYCLCSVQETVYKWWLILSSSDNMMSQSTHSWIKPHQLKRQAMSINSETKNKSPPLFLHLQPGDYSCETALWLGNGMQKSQSWENKQCISDLSDCHMSNIFMSASQGKHLHF